VACLVVTASFLVLLEQLCLSVMDGSRVVFICSSCSRKVLGFTPTEVFALAQRFSMHNGFPMFCHDLCAFPVVVALLADVYQLFGAVVSKK
jgi:hypothetical protein